MEAVTDVATDVDVNRLSDQAGSWLSTNGLTVLGIVVGVFILSRFSRAFIEKVIRRAIKPGRYTEPAAERKREDTLIRVFGTAFDVILYVTAFIMVLSEFGVDTTPLLASAGIAGVAIGFGGQYLIRDFITGFFIILENQYRVGDVVCFGTTCGLVEDINLRITILRDMDGTVHHVPNGEIKIASNLSKDHSNVNINVGVAYDTDMKKVIALINHVGQEMAKDKDWKEDIIEAPHFLRIDKFGDSSIDLKILGKTQPIRQWDVAGELRLRLKEAFDKEGIEIPFPQRVMREVKPAPKPGKHSK